MSHSGNGNKKYSFSNAKAQEFNSNSPKNCYNNSNNGDMSSGLYQNKLEGWKPVLFLPEPIEENENDCKSFIFSN